MLNEWGELDLEAMTIKGTSDVIEKEYLRLTSPPHPHTVRPESVLRQALKMVKKKRKTGTCDYEYACSQFKSMRQDLTVRVCVCVCRINRCLMLINDDDNVGPADQK